MVETWHALQAVRPCLRLRHGGGLIIAGSHHHVRIAAMTTFEDRERAEEAKFAHDEEMLFRIQARRNKLLGNWAAERMGLDAAETEAYARSVVQAEFEDAGDEEVIRKVLGDLLLAGVEVGEAEVRKALEAKTVEARRQMMGDV
jgi:hypothetical protein